MVLSLLFPQRNSIFHIRFFLRLLYLTLVSLKQSTVRHYLVFADYVSVPKKTHKKNILIAKLLRINNVMYYVRRLCVSYRMNVRTSQKMLGVHR